MPKSLKREIAGRENGIRSGQVRLERYSERKDELYEYFDFWMFDLSTHGAQTILAKHLMPMIDCLSFERKVIAHMCEHFNRSLPICETFFMCCRRGIYGKPISYRTLKDDYLRSICNNHDDSLYSGSERISMAELQTSLSQV